MKYRVEFKTSTGHEVTEIEASNEHFARAAFYEIYSRTLTIISLTGIYQQAA